MTNFKSLIMIVLLIQVFALTDCKTQNKNKKEAVIPTIDKPAGINPVQNISIHEAALNGQSAEVTKMLEEGADVNAKDQDGRTALMYAAFNGHTEIIEKLIRKGASVNLCDSFGRTALMFASSGPYPAAVKLLLTNRADPNIADTEEHFTALMFAAAEGQLEIVRLLIAAKADPALSDIDGDKAITFAEKNGHKDVVLLLSPFLK